MTFPYIHRPLLIPFALALVALAFGILLFRAPLLPVTITSEHVAQARLAPGTEGLTKQAAQHISKLTGGGSVGGLPPFRPPGNDKKYREKIKSRNYSPEEANYWIKELNKFLRQISDKNPDMNMREILTRQGLNELQATEFLAQLREVSTIAEGMSGHGVSPEAARVLLALLSKLGVP